MKIIQKILIEDVKRFQITNVFRLESEFSYIAYKLCDSRHYGVSAVKGYFSEKNVEHRHFIACLIFIITLHHGKLIQVRKQSKVLSHDISFIKFRFFVESAP